MKLSGLQKRLLIAAWKKPGRRLSRGELLSGLMKEQRGRTENSIGASLTCACGRLKARGLVRVIHNSRYAAIELTKTGVAAAEHTLGATEVERLGKLAARRKRDAAQRADKRAAAKELKRLRDDAPLRVFDRSVDPASSRDSAIPSMNIVQADAQHIPLKDRSVQMCITSPPFWRARDYHTPPRTWPDGWIGELGLEPTVSQYVAHLVACFEEVRRVLRDDGTAWIHIEDGYAGGGRGHRDPKRWPKQVGNAHYALHGKKSDPGLKDKDLAGAPWTLALALRDAGWYLRSEIIVEKRNPMPEASKDRPSRSHGSLFLLSKQPIYFYDGKSISEPAIRGARRNRYDVWTINGEHNHRAHFAVMPAVVVERCVLAGSRPGDIVLDPFLGSGRTGEVCQRLGRRLVGCDLKMEYLAGIAKRHISPGQPLSRYARRDSTVHAGRTRYFSSEATVSDDQLEPAAFAWRPDDT